MILGTFKEKTGTLDGRQRASATRSSEVDTDEDAGSAKLAGWAYVGSHNFTPSAWGTLSGSGFNPSLNVRPILLISSCAFITEKKTRRSTTTNSE